MKIIRHYTCHPEVETFAPSGSNQITEDYYNLIVGEINRRTIKAAVCAISNLTYGITSYYLISRL